MATQTLWTPRVSRAEPGDLGLQLLGLQPGLGFKEGRRQKFSFQQVLQMVQKQVGSQELEQLSSQAGTQ